MRRENPVNDCGKEEIPGDQEAVRLTTRQNRLMVGRRENGGAGSKPAKSRLSYFRITDKGVFGGESHDV